MKFNKKKIALTIILFLGIFLLYCFTGSTKTIFKNVPKLEVNNTLNFQSSLLWPIEQDEKAIAGEGVGVAIDSYGNIYYLHRGSNVYGDNKSLIREPTIIKIDANTGKVLNKLGENIFVSPHGLEVDSNNNIWVTDVALNKVFKLSSSGEIIQKYGDDYPFYLEILYLLRNKLPRFPVFARNTTFARPTDIVVNEDGSFIVTDGYRNKRLVKFDSTGSVIWEIDKSGSDNGEFNLPHGLAQDDDGNLYVADRKNSRIQVFSSDGMWINSWEQPELGRPYGIDFGLDGNLYLVDGGDMLEGLVDNPRSNIVKLDKQGNIIGKFGTYGQDIGQLDIPHDIVVGLDGSIYIAELRNNRLQKFIFD